MATSNVYTCSFSGCPVQGGPDIMHRHGQVPSKDRWCRDHFPYDRCSVCNSKLRPHHSKARDWPGTRAKDSSVRCTTHRAGQGRSIVDIRGNLRVPWSKETAEAAVRYMERTNNLDLKWMLGL